MRVRVFLTGALVWAAAQLGAIDPGNRPETWFHLIGGNVSKAGLTADLEAIKAAGIGGIQLFHGQMGQNLTWPGVTNPIPCLSANWDDMVAHAAAECRRLGLSFKMQNCPGWSMSGGPWIRPGNAMRNLCYAPVQVRKGMDTKLPLPAPATDGPDRDYHDLFVVAFPTPEGDGNGWLVPKETRSPSARSRVFVFEKPVTVRTLELPPTSELDHNRTYDPEMTAVLEVETAPGVWRTVIREALPPGNWQDNRRNGTRYTLACDETTATTWRLTIESVDQIRLGTVRLSSAARMEHWEGLAGWTVRGLVDRGTPKQDPRCWIDSRALVDLTGRLRPDGTLDWSPADARPWTVLRIGHVNGGYRNGPAPQEATGWECSKLSPRGIEANYAAYVGRLAKGPLKGRLDGLVVDSWECYRDNWTEGLEKTFAARCGYDLIRWLPSVFGWVVGSPSETERFLRDWRGLLGRLVEENYYGRLAALAHADGLTVQYETSFGDALAGDLLEFWKHADTPMCEFWRPTAPTGVGSHDFKAVKPCVSAAHVYGRGRVAAEALTNCALTWDEKPGDFKTVVDRHFARGVTHLVLHTYTHNPQVGFKKPGTSFGYFIGTPFIRGQDWWKHMPAFTDYATRCGEFLEAGKPVVDVLRVLGDGLGHKPSERSEGFRNRFKDDYVNKDVLTTRLSVRNGRLALPDGMEYAVLWIPEGTYLDAASVRRIEELERQGAKVVRGGDPTAGLTADVVSPDGKLLWYHRRVAGEDRYFVAACDAACAGDVFFRGRRVRLDLQEGESRFVTFGPRGVGIVDPVTGREVRACAVKPSERVLARCAGETAWRGRLSAKRGERVWLDLGTVHGVAEVFVNGRSAATCWCAPWRCELTDALNEGTNDVRVAVATTWYNRLRADQAKPESDRAYWTISPPRPEAPAKPEGLHGTVRLLSAPAEVSAAVEDENVGGGALEKNKVVEMPTVVRSVAETFAPGLRTFDEGWEFRLSDSAVNFTKVGIGVNDNGLTRLFRETNGWAGVDIPHDWMIAQPVARNGRNGFRAVGPSHPDRSVGWYRKRFTVPGKVDVRPCVWLKFDGIYRDAQFWVNGIYLGRNDSGYIGCRFDVTDLIEYGGAENTVAVRVDASRTEGWWYEGAGIYRHVKLIVKNPDHIRPDGILFRTLEASADRAVVSAAAEVEGTGRVVFELDGVAFEKNLVVEKPKLWSPDAPNLHTLVARLLGADGRVMDEVSLRVGIRRFVFDPNRGLLVNGVPTKVKGVCCHGDMGGVGVAIPDALHDFRVKRLKEMGVNADRTCHNPPTPEFLDACDRGGILVMDETRLFASTDEGLSQFRRLVLRDRNHPCVAAWSVGNEEHNVQAHEVGARMARRMKRLAKSLAPDIAVTYGGNNGPTWTGVNGVVDVRGVNYVRIGTSDKTRRGFFDAPDRYHAAHPEQPIWGSEEASALSTRGSTDEMGPKDVQLMKDGDHPDDNVRFPWVATAEQWWNYAIARDWFAGAMVWTGFDYRGESRWPATCNNFGIMDLCGFPKASYWYYKANWTDEDVLNVWPKWKPGVTNLWIDSNCDAVELFVNGRSVGRRTGDRRHHLSVPVVYEPGTVVARGWRGGREIVFRMKTPEQAVRLVLTADRTTLAADGTDATVVDVRALDAAGDEAVDSCELVSFTCAGAGKIIGVGNGNPLSHEDDVCVDGQWKRRLFNGRCQVVLKAGCGAGTLRLTAQLAPEGARSEAVLAVQARNAD